MVKQKKHVIDEKKWIDRYANYLYNYTITRVNNTVIAEDLVQETFLAGLRSKGNFKGDASERTWLISILKRKIIDHYRKISSNKGKAEVRMSLSSNDEDGGDWLEEKAKDLSYRSAENNIENTELGLAIEKCLEKLPVKQAIIFRQKTILEYDTESICKEHDITASNLWVIVHRARVQLMQCLNTNWFK